jgi:Glycosyltransferase family 17
MTAPRVFDLIMLGTETDMLECRLREFEAMDCCHVVVEAPITHRNVPKPLYYADNKERFAPWSDRIIHVVANDLPVPGNPWVTEHAQRDRGWQAVENQARDSDVILLADVDEFPSAEALEGTFPVAALSQKLCMYAVDWMVPDPHICSVVASGRFMRGKQAAAVRDGRYGYHTLRNAGWHITWLGGVEGQQQKLLTSCHLEMRDDEVERISSGTCYRSGLHHAGDLQLLPVDVDETWPKAIYKREVPTSWFRPRGAA